MKNISIKYLYLACILLFITCNYSCAELSITSNNNRTISGDQINILGLSQRVKIGVIEDDKIEINIGGEEITITFVVSSEYQVAFRFLKIKDTERAIKEFHSLSQKHPNEHSFWWLGAAYLVAGNIENSIKNLEKSQEFKFNYESSDLLCLTYRINNEQEKSLPNCNKAINDFSINDNKKLSVSYVQRALVYKQIGNLTASLKDYDKAIELNPHNAQAYSNRGVVLRSLNFPDKALSDYNKALELDPYFATAYVNRGILYRNINDINKALEDLNNAIQLDQTIPSAYHSRGNIFTNRNEIDKGINDYNKAIELNPIDPIYYFSRCIAYKNKSQQDLFRGIEYNQKAVSDCDQACKLGELSACNLH